MNSCDSRSVDQKPFEFGGREAIIPWAEGNGLWVRITGLASSLSGADIITFFARNPHSCDSAEELAVRIGRQVSQVRPVLEELEAAGFLQVTELGGLRVYRLADNPDHRQTLQQYVIWLQEGYHWARIGMDR
jgi:hypothetical protein